MAGGPADVFHGPSRVEFLYLQRESLGLVIDGDNGSAVRKFQA